MAISSPPVDTQPMPFRSESGPGSLRRLALSGVLLDQIREGLVRFEQDLSIISGNRSWWTMVGGDAKELKERSLSELLAADDVERLRAAMTLFTGDVDEAKGGRELRAESDTLHPIPETQDLSLVWRCGDGRRVESHTVLFIGRQVSEEQPEGRCVFHCLIHDLTVENLATEERNRLREQLEESGRNQSLGILAGGLAHDFNNVLAAILGLVEVARMQLPEGSPAAATLGEVTKTADYASILVSNLLAYSGRGREKTQPVDLSSVVRELGHWVVEHLRPRAEVEVSCASGLPMTLGDPKQLRQVFTNLVINAEEALREVAGMESGRRRTPRIRIETGVQWVSLADLQTTIFAGKPEPGPYLYVEVWDNGSGIDPAALGRVFDPFFTSKVSGRGLGLAAVQGIIFNHSGFIGLDTEPGRGTAARVYLPIHQTESKDSAGGLAERPAGLESPVGQELKSDAPAGDTSESTTVREKRTSTLVRDLNLANGRILVVDDEEAIRGMAETTLGLAGYEVTTAEDGLAGWNLIREQPDGFICVLLDITMPKMTGDEVLERIRQIRPRLPVILSSGFSTNEAVFSRLSDDPFTHFLKKPYRTRKLKLKILELVSADA